MENRIYDKIYACWLGKNIGGLSAARSKAQGAD